QESSAEKRDDKVQKEDSPGGAGSRSGGVDTIVAQEFIVEGDIIGRCDRLICAGIEDRLLLQRQGIHPNLLSHLLGIFEDGKGNMPEGDATAHAPLVRALYRTPVQYPDLPDV